MSCNRDMCLCVGAEDALADEIKRLHALLATADRRVADMREAAARWHDEQANKLLVPIQAFRGKADVSRLQEREAAHREYAATIRALPNPDAQPPSEAQWQTMESAPKDGQLILGWDAGGDVYACYWQNDCWFTGWMVWSCRSDGQQVYPVYWLPLPPLPAQPPSADGDG